MTKKIFVTIFVLLATLLFGSCVFANNNTTMGTEAQNSWDKLTNSTQNIGNNVRGAMDNIGDTLTGNNDNNTINNATTNNNNTNTNTNTSNTNNDDGWFSADTNNDDGYTATRTTAMTTDNGGGLFGMNNSTMWTWLILAILGVAIVSLVWSYSNQTTHHRNDK